MNIIQRLHPLGTTSIIYTSHEEQIVRVEPALQTYYLFTVPWTPFFYLLQQFTTANGLISETTVLLKFDEG